VVQIKQNEKYDASKIDERHRDHALYMAFAPADDPRIALAMVVENAGFGSQNAAPIARRVFDYWLMGKYPSEADIAAVVKAQVTAPLGEGRRAEDVPMVLAVARGASPSVAPAASAGDSARLPARNR
jgi:penicillin-binding protein 2